MNGIALSGTVAEALKFSHETRGEKIYSFKITVERASGTCDTLPCFISEAYVNESKEEIELDKKIRIFGEIRTRNANDENGNRHLEVSVFVHNVSAYEGNDENAVELDGYVCKEAKYRETPLGRQIADMTIASNRLHGLKSDYIPCIAWGRSAIRASYMPIGCHVNIQGRLQSRKYTKKLDGGDYEERIAYELSVSRLEALQDENNN